MFCSEPALFFTHPLEQFEIFILLSYWYNVNISLAVCLVTNLTMLCVMATAIIRTILFIKSYGLKVNTIIFFLDSIYKLVNTIIKGNLSLKRYQYFTTLFFLFIFLFIVNMLGLIPYTFTLTSSFIITFFIALGHFIGTNLVGVFKEKWESTEWLLPGGVPLVIIPFLSLIESISYLAKVFSLSIRIFANMLSGHALLKILIGFAWNLLKSGSIFAWLSIIPWAVVTIILFLEGLIAFLQAYVFTMLVTIYVNDVVTKH